VVTLQGSGRYTDGYWLHSGKLVVRSALELQPPEQPPGGTASLVLPNGVITTPMLAAQACQQLLGSYVQLTTFTLSSTSTWTETPAQVNVTFGGNLVRIEFAFGAFCPIKGQRVAWGIMVDGAAPLVTLGGLDAPEANYGSMAAGCYYLTPSASSHRIGIGLFGPSGAGLISNLATTLYVTEQKR
jgi:hypothetical protein